MVDYSSNILVVEVDSLILLREVGFTGSFEGAFVSASGEQFLD